MKHCVHYIRKLQSFLLLLTILLLVSDYCFGQSSGDYRTATTGNWNALSTWETYNGTTWIAATSTPTNTSGVITIRNGHTVSVTASVNIDQTIIEPAGQITVNSGQTLRILNGSGTDMTVNGTLVNRGTVTITTTETMVFNSGSVYEHAQNGGDVPYATWDSNSLCNITGITGGDPVRALNFATNPTLGNFTWNCPAQTGGSSLPNSNYTITGTLTITSTGSSTVQLIRGSYTGNVADYVQTGGTAFFGGNTTSTKTLNVSGTFNLSGGTFNIDNGNGTSSSIFNLSGDFTQSGGTFTRQSTTSGICRVNFNGSTTQTFTKSAGTISGDVDFAIISGSTVDFGTSILSGSTGEFTLNSGGAIITAHTQGLSTTAGTGSIQVTGTKSYNTGASYTYNGTSAQVTGNGLTGSNNLTINNNTGVTLTSNVTVSGTLYLTAGILATGANTLTVTNNSSSAISGGSTTSFVNGPLRWQLATGSTYSFPVGAGTTYLPFGLTAITGTTPRISVQAFAAGTGGSATPPLMALSTTEYWQASVVSGTYSGGSVSLTRQSAINEMDAIGRNTTTLNGAYSSLDGTVSGTSIINSNNTGASLGYFVMATKKSITTGAISGSPFCAGSGLSVPFSITGTFYTGNVFTAQLSDASGSFASPVAIGTLASTTASAPVSCTIPLGTVTGTGYRIRVVSDTPILAGTNNGIDLTIYSSHLWTGTTSSDWNVVGNWICGSLPDLVNSVQIPDVSNEPVLSTGSVGVVNNLTIDAGSSLTVDGNTLQIAGAITNNGTFTASAGTIEMTGSAAQTIPANAFTGPVKNLTINNSSGVTLLGTLNVTDIVAVQSGTLASNGYLTLASTAAQTALIDGSGTGTVTGNVIMQRYLPSGFGYKYFSSPFQAATVNEFGDDMDLGATFPTFYRYNENRTSSGWVRYNYPDSLLKQMHGYAVNFGSNPAANTADVTGVVNNGSLSLTLYNHNNTYTQGFNLVGNPYPSPIDWDAASGWTKTNIDDALYYFKASAVDQYGGTYSTYINGISSDGLATNIIPSMQGLFVHVTDGSYPMTGILALDNSVRVTDLTHSFIKSGVSKSGNSLRFMAVFSANPASQDPAVIYFNEKALEAFDGQLDGLKLMNTDYNVPNLYIASSDGRKLSISALPFVSDTLRVVPLGLKTNINGTVIFRLLDFEGVFSEMEISIYDNVTGIEQILHPDNEYSVYLPYGEYQNRFFLNLSNISTGIPGNVNDPGLIRIYSSHGIIKAEINSLQGEKAEFRLYDLTGQIIFIKDIYAPGYYEFDPHINDGIYIVSYISGTKRYIKKIFILN